MNDRPYSPDITAAISSYLTEDDWHFSFDEQRGHFRFSLSLAGKLKKIHYTLKVRKNSYCVYAYSPLGADAGDSQSMAAMAEFVCRANYGLKDGNFELDMRDGEIRFKCFVDCEGITPSPDMVSNSLYCPAAMFERYGPGILDVIFGKVPAEEAVERCEAPSTDELRSLLSKLESGEDSSDHQELIDEVKTLLGLTDQSIRAGVTL